MNPGHGFMETNRATLFCSINPGCTDGVVSGDSVQVSRERAQSNVQVAGTRASTLAAGAERRDHRGHQGHGRDQAHALVDLQHVSALVEQRLLRSVALRLSL